MNVSDSFFRNMKRYSLILWPLLICMSCQHDLASPRSDPKLQLETTVNDMMPSDIADDSFQKCIVKSTFIIDPLVENGSSYEEFIIQLQDHLTEIVVPANVIVRRGAQGVMHGKMEKTLHWAGHPGGTEKTSIVSERKEMGIAAKIVGRKLHLMPFGAWDSMIEGGASVTAIVGVPPLLRVQRIKNTPDNYSKEKLRADGWHIIKTAPSSKTLFENTRSNQLN